MRGILRFSKKYLPNFLPIPYLYKFKLNFFFLPKHHWTQYLQKTYEPETFEKIKEIFRDNSIRNFWDIGANVGLYSVFIGIRYGCNINSFEPAKKYYKFLEYNTSFSERIKTHNFGIGSSDGIVNIILTEEPGSNFISINKLDKKINNVETCQLKTIKNLQGIEPPNLVKIDVEGFEYEILKSSIDFFKKNKTLLILEIDEEHLERYSQDKKDIIDLLNSRNYLIERIANSNNYYCFF